MRLLILLGVIYLCYRALKSWMLQSGSSKKTVFDKPASQIDDVMIKDPYCEIYFPKKDGCSSYGSFLFSHEKPGPLGQVRDIWLCQ
jgi:hypothetical protein